MNKDEYFPKFYDIDGPIRTFVTKRLIGIDCESTVQEAAERMVEFNISSLVVMKEDDIVGFFTEGDIKKDVVAKGLKPDIPVKEIMTTDLITVNIGDEIKDVLQTMTDKNIKHVLVREDGEIVGIVTFRDLIDIERRRLETYISRE